MAQTNISIRIDEDVKREAESLFSKLGLTLSSATNVFFRQAVRTQGIPFNLSVTPPLSQKNLDASQPKRQLGFLKDKIPALPDSFFDPLPEEELQAWGL